MKIGIFIGRMQPLHLGHQKIITESISNNDFTFIMLGSSGIINEYNPFSDLERKNFIENIFKEYRNKYKIINLQDSDSDEKWVKNIENIIKNNIENEIKNLTFYGGDFKNDYAIKVLKEYEDILNFDDINFREISRNSIFTIHKGEKVYISSTLVRQSLLNKDLDLLEKLLDVRVFELLIDKIS
ncbi:MAG: adenylyltransferase/cytidyltransferase family protein [Candidatus Gracilibacteria bacterium]|nr:adenylyltransferase/cytidyltransferase family protein [Candidatus Gracilibacteria bacterium]